MRNVRLVSTRLARVMSPVHARRPVRCSFTCRRITSSPATPIGRTSKSTPTAPEPRTVLSKLAGERAVAAAVGESLHRAHRVAVEQGAHQLPHDHDAAGARAGARVGRRRSARFPYLGARPRRGAHRSADSRAPFGVYHCTNSGETTWFGLAKAIFTELGADSGRVVPVTTDVSARPARWTAYSVLGTNRWQSVGSPSSCHPGEWLCTPQ